MLTQPADSVVSTFHHRMPVSMDFEGAKHWIDTGCVPDTSIALQAHPMDHFGMKKRPTWNPVNPFTGLDIEWEQPPEDSRVMVSVDDSKTIITENNSPDIPFGTASIPIGVAPMPAATAMPDAPTSTLALALAVILRPEYWSNRRLLRLLRAHFMKPNGRENGSTFRHYRSLSTPRRAV